MDSKRPQGSQRNRFLKLSLRKNHNIADIKLSQTRSPECISLDDTFDRLKLDLRKNLNPVSTIHSPIVINDSDTSHDEELPRVVLTQRTPSRQGNVSFNCSRDDSINEFDASKPSVNDGWSPAQPIICATPRHDTVPSTPRDVANESLEQCSLKKIQHSQKKLLDDLYGESWKSIPTLFKTISHKYENFDGVSKKLQFDDDDSDKENVRDVIKANKELYLTGSDAKRKGKTGYNDTEKKSKKKLYTEIVPSTPDLPKVQKKVPKSSKTKAKSVTELVEIMKKDVDGLRRKIDNVKITPTEKVVNRLSFMGSLADNVPSWRCHPEAIQYHDNFKNLKEQLARRLFAEFNRVVFDNQMDSDMPILWDSKLRSTAGTTTNRLIKTSNGARVRTSTVKLSTKVVDGPARLRDTLVHELCHSATWLVDAELRAGHGPVWRKWASRALLAFPELGEISRCHNLEIHFKYCYKCIKCGYSIQRHSKSIDVTKKCCGYCRGTFELKINRKNKDGVVITTPARAASGTGPTGFARFVKENYASVKSSGTTHAQVMKILGERYAAQKKEKGIEVDSEGG